MLCNLFIIYAVITDKYYWAFIPFNIGLIISFFSFERFFGKRHNSVFSIINIILFIGNIIWLGFLVYCIIVLTHIINAFIDSYKK